MLHCAQQTARYIVGIQEVFVDRANRCLHHLFFVFLNTLFGKVPVFISQNWTSSPGKICTSSCRLIKANIQNVFTYLSEDTNHEYLTFILRSGNLHHLQADFQKFKTLLNHKTNQKLNWHIVNCRSYVQEWLKVDYRSRLFICETHTVLTLHKWVIGYAQSLHKCAARTTQCNHLLLHLAEECCVSKRPLCFVWLSSEGFPFLQCSFNVPS